MALVVGGIIVALAFTNWDENANKVISDAFTSLGKELDTIF